jgi:hypothetical protein
MRHSVSLTPLLGLLLIAAPVQAQDGDVAMAYFVTTDTESVLELEEAIQEHVQWHAGQNDPWPGLVFQAMTGGMEYVWVTPGRTWGDFDSPPVDPHEDMVDFVERAGSSVMSLDIQMWSVWSDLSRSPAPDAMVPIWEVLEFDFVNSAEGREALLNAFRKVKDAMDGQGLPIRYNVNEVQASDTGPGLFVSIAHDSFGELDGGDPNGLQMLLTQAYGHAEGVQVIRTLEQYLTPTARRFWVLRPDLSHMPPM